MNFKSMEIPIRLTAAALLTGFGFAATTAQASPAFTLRPMAGNSTKTTSVNSCWAWSVMPMVATSPARRTHSWDFAYFRSAGMFELICVYN